jgi:uncharacterized protein (TIGR02996 family)
MPMQEQWFLDAILECPEDDCPRLVFADWLEERGDPRGEFIRVQCELAQLPPGDPRRATLEACEQQMLLEHDEEWAGKLSRYAESWTFRRGILEEATISAAEFLAHADDLAEQPEVRCVKITELYGQWPELRRIPALARLSGLDLSGNSLTGGGVEMVEIPFDRLRILRLAGCQVFPWALRRLATAGGLTRLRELDLSDNPLGDEGAQILAQADGWRELRTLKLGGGWQTDYTTRIHAAGAAALAHSPILANLTALDLSENDVGDGGIIALAQSPHLSQLVSLSVRGNDIGGIAESGVQALVASANLSNLRRLDLRNNAMEAWAARNMVENFRLDGLQDLDLGGCLSTAGVRAVAAARKLRGLRSLGLSGSSLRDDSAYVLAGSPHLGGLQCLDLRDNPLSPAGRRHLEERFGNRVILDGPRSAAEALFDMNM